MAIVGFVVFQCFIKQLLTNTIPPDADRRGRRHPAKSISTQTTISVGSCLKSYRYTIGGAVDEVPGQARWGYHVFRSWLGNVPTRLFCSKRCIWATLREAVRPRRQSHVHCHACTVGHFTCMFQNSSHPLTAGAPSRCLTYDAERAVTVMSLSMHVSEFGSQCAPVLSICRNRCSRV